jgi:integrase
MSAYDSSERHVVVWVQHCGDRPYLDLRWHDPVTGRPKRRSAKTCNPLDAERKRAALEYELNHGLYREASRMQWDRFRTLFEAEFVAGKRPDTRKNYRVTLDLFERHCAPRSLRSVTERTVSSFAAALRSRPGKHGEPQKASTIKVRLQYLHTVLQWAVSQKLLPECPTFPRVKVPKQRPRPTPAESFERLLTKAGDDLHMRAYLLCGWKAGLRLNEALALEWEETDQAPWLDPARGRIWLPAGFVKAVEDQWVPLDPDLYAALDLLPRRGSKVFHFVEARSGKPVGDVAVCNRIAELARRAGVRLTMKELRKGFGCTYAGKVPAQVLQKLMRHSNIRVTMDYYANVDEAAMRAVLGDRHSGLPDSVAESTEEGGRP